MIGKVFLTICPIFTKIDLYSYMISFIEWLKMREAGAGVPYVGQSAGGSAGGWWGAAGDGKMSSVGDVEPKRSRKKHHKKKKHHKMLEYQEY